MTDQEIARIEKLERQVEALWQLVQFISHRYELSQEEIEIYHLLMMRAITGRSSNALAGSGRHNL
jgi:hypothetical protein